jgi:hypothetical protein
LNRNLFPLWSAAQPAHELPGTALADSKDALDGLAVQVVAFQDVKFGEDGTNSWEPGGFRRHKRSLPLFTLREGTMRQSAIEKFFSPALFVRLDEPPAASRTQLIGSDPA